MSDISNWFFALVLLVECLQTFLRGKGLPKYTNLQQILNGIVLTLLIACLSFPLLVFSVICIYPRRLRILHLFTVYPAMSHWAFKKKETVFICNTLNNKKEYFMNLNITFGQIFNLIIVTRLFAILLNIVSFIFSQLHCWKIVNTEIIFWIVARICSYWAQFIL